MCLDRQRGKPGPASPGGKERWLFWSALHLIGPHPSNVCAFGHHDIRKTLTYSRVSKGGYEDGKRFGRKVLQGAAEVTWFIHPVEEELEGTPHCNFKHPHEEKQRTRCWSLVTTDKTQGNESCLKLSQEMFSLHIRKRFFSSRMVGN